MVQIYSFREDLVPGFKNHDKADPQAIGEALQKITDGNNGRLTPSAVVTEATKRSHPLHRHFEWDDTVAAEAFRLDQARSLISSIEITSTDSDRGAARAFLSINDRGGRAYHAVSEVLVSRDLQLGVLRLALRDLTAFEKRFRDIQDICELVRVARDKLASKLHDLDPDRDPDRPHV